MEDGLPSSNSIPITSAEVALKSTVIVPHPSPKKGMKGSFLPQNRSPKLSVPNTPPKSPAVQAMDEILARSHARQQQQAGQSSDNSVTKSPALSARRRLSLSSDKVYLHCTCTLYVHLYIHTMCMYM